MALSESNLSMFLPLLLIISFEDQSCGAKYAKMVKLSGVSGLITVYFLNRQLSRSAQPSHVDSQPYGEV